MKNLFVFLTFLTFFSCHQKISKNDNAIDSLGLELKNDMSAMGSFWILMINSDDNKISNLKRLVEELKLVDGSSEEDLNGIKAKIESLEASRYSRNSMQNSSSIDFYDSLTNSAISEVRRAINVNPNAVKFQIINQLIAEIQAADDSVLHFRKQYDRSVDSYNSFFKINLDKLKSKRPELDSLKMYPVFRLIP